jgi:phage terminase large subunit GpA-like protein
MERWTLPCPGCGALQELVWANIVFEHMYDSEAGRLSKDGEVLCKCPACGELSNEASWKSGAGEWSPANADAAVKSFQLNSLVSPWKSWRSVVEAFLTAKNDAEMLKVWTNTEMGETWIEDGETVDGHALLRRREFYNCMVPDKVLVLTAGVDVQDNRFEMEVVGWGKDKISWGIEYKTVHGNTSLPEIWDLLD